MSEIIKLKRSSVPGKRPDLSQLSLGELAINTYDGKAFMRKSGSEGEQIIEIGTQIVSGSGIQIVNVSGSQQVVVDVNYVRSLFSATGSIYYDPSLGVISLQVSQSLSSSNSYLVWDNGLIEYRTAAQVLSDIGAQPSGSYAPASGSGNYIQNQSAVAQNASFWVNGTARVDNRLTLFNSGANTTIAFRYGGSTSDNYVWESNSNNFMQMFNYDPTVNKYVYKFGSTGVFTIDPYASMASSTISLNITKGSINVASGDFKILGGNIYRTAASGTDVAATDLSIIGGAGTGTGKSGDILFSTYPTGVVSGTGIGTLTERMRVTNSGQVGINTSTFIGTEKLRVNGSVQLESNLTFGTASINGVSASPLMIDMGGTFSDTAGTNLKLRIYNDGTYTYGIGASSLSLDYVVGYSGASHTFYSAATKLMTLNGAGQLMINATTIAGSAAEKLKVSGNVRVDNNLVVGSASNYTGGYALQVNGGAFIAPGGLMTDGMIAFGSQTAIVNQIASFRSSILNGSRALWLTANDFTFNTYTGSAYTLFGVINNSGQWGIGTNAFIGTEKLRVNGGSYFDGSITATSTLARGMVVTNTLVAAANNDVLVGLDINPTFTPGSFTGVTKYGLRVQSGDVYIPSNNVLIGTTLNSFASKLVALNAISGAQATNNYVSSNFLTVTTPSGGVSYAGIYGRLLANGTTASGTESGGVVGVLYIDGASYSYTTNHVWGAVIGTLNLDHGGTANKISSLKAAVNIFNGSTATEYYGVYIQPPIFAGSGTNTISNHYPIFQESPTGRNYFNSPIMIGNTVIGTERLLVNGTSTAVSALAKSVNITSTLTAAANSDTLIGIDINPTYSLGTFINSLGTITGGSGYTNGTYNGVALTNISGAGSGATANITVAGGVVTTVTLVNKGSGYAVNNIVSADPTTIGGTGTGFQVPIATIGFQSTTSRIIRATTPVVNATSFEIIPSSLSNGSLINFTGIKLNANMDGTTGAGNVRLLDLQHTNPSGGTPNVNGYLIYTKGGGNGNISYATISQLGTVSIGSVENPSGLGVTSFNQIPLYVTSPLSTTATSSGNLSSGGGAWAARFENAAGNTSTTGNLVKGGLYIKSTGTLSSSNLTANNYGIWIDTSGASTANYSIYANTGLGFFKDGIQASRYIQTQPTAIASAATTTIDLSTGNVFQVNMGANITTLTLNNSAIGIYFIKFTQDATGSRTISWPAGWKWSGGSSTALTTTADKTDILTLTYDGTLFFASLQTNF
jgi:hypothetical protein